MTVKQCPHCGHSFNTELVDIDNHMRNCKRHGKEVVQRNITRVKSGKRPTRTGW